MKFKKSMLFSLVVLVICTALFIGYELYQIEHETRNYQVSVILPYDGAGEWKNLQQGMKQAAEDYNLLIRYIIMAENSTPIEQTEILRREIENGVDGVLLGAIDADFLSNAVEKAKKEVEIVIVESGVKEVDVPIVSGCNYDMGELLGKKVLEDGNVKIAVICPEAERTYTEERMEGFAKNISESTKIVCLEYKNEEKAVDNILKKIFCSTEYDCVVCVDTVTLEKCSDYFSEFHPKAKLYGIGTSSKVAAKVDKGVIEAIVCQNEFSIGYKAVAKLAGLLQKKEYGIENVTKYGLVTSENLYDTEYQELLFPISK